MIHQPKKFIFAYLKTPKTQLIPWKKPTTLFESQGQEPSYPPPPYGKIVFFGVTICKKNAIKSFSRFNLYFKSQDFILTFTQPDFFPSKTLIL